MIKSQQCFLCWTNGWHVFSWEKVGTGRKCKAGNIKKDIGLFWFMTCSSLKQVSLWSLALEKFVFWQIAFPKLNTAFSSIRIREIRAFLENGELFGFLAVFGNHFWVACVELNRRPEWLLAIVTSLQWQCELGLFSLCDHLWLCWLFLEPVSVPRMWANEIWLNEGVYSWAGQ